jgi:hypothetical protein
MYYLIDEMHAEWVLILADFGNYVQKIHGYVHSNNRILGRDGLCESCFETRRMYTQAYDIEGKRSVKDLENIGPSKGWHGILSGPIPSYSCLTADKLARAAARKAIQNVQVT